MCIVTPILQHRLVLRKEMADLSKLTLRSDVLTLHRSVTERWTKNEHFQTAQSSLAQSIESIDLRG